VLQFRALDVHGVAAERGQRRVQIDVLRQRDGREAWERAKQRGQRGADRVLGQVDQARPREELDDAGRQIRRHRMVFENSLFVHFDLLPQLVAYALQALAHGCRGGAGARGQAFGAPAAVVMPLAQPALVLGEVDERAGEVALLSLGPSALVDVEHRWPDLIVEWHPLRAGAAPAIERAGDHDAPQPAGKGLRALELVEPAERPEVSALDRVARVGLPAQHPPGHGIGHPLGGLDQSGKSRQLARPRRRENAGLRRQERFVVRLERHVL